MVLGLSVNQWLVLDFISQTHVNSSLDLSVYSFFIAKFNLFTVTWRRPMGSLTYFLDQCVTLIPLVRFYG
jgi:hypothetical protein